MIRYSETLADMTRMNWLPTCYVPAAELRWLRNLLRYRAFRTRLFTGVKNRTKSEFRKSDISLEVNHSTQKGRKAAANLGVFKVPQKVDLFDVINWQTKEVEDMFRRKYDQIKLVLLLMTIPGIGFLSAVRLYTEIMILGGLVILRSLRIWSGLCLGCVSRVRIQLWARKLGVMLGRRGF